MEFFFPRQKINFFEDPWVSRQQEYQRRLRQQQRRQQQKRNFGDDRILDDQYYYDPLFGDVFNRKMKPSRASECDCKNCQRERYLKKNTQGQMVPEFYNQHQTSPSSQVFLEQEPILNNKDESEQEYSSDEEEEIGEQNVNEEPNTPDIEEENEDLETGVEELNINITQSEDEVVENKDEENLRKYEIEKKITLIDEIKKDLEKTKEKIDHMSSTVKDKEYLYCEEMLTKYLLRLDDILAEGEETIRQARKKVVNEINDTLKNMEEKFSSEL